MFAPVFTFHLIRFFGKNQAESLPHFSLGLFFQKLYNRFDGRDL